MSLAQRLPFVPRALIAAMGGLLVVLLGVSHAWAQSSEPLSTGTLGSPTVDPGDAVDPGESITLSGSGFAPGGQIDLVIESDPMHLGTTYADATGSFSVTVQIPVSGLPSGAHTLKAIGPDPRGGLRILSVPVEVDAASDAPDPTGRLPVTGAAAGRLVVIGLGALLIGSALVRRQRRAA